MTRFWIKGRRLWRARKPLAIQHADWSNPMTVVVHHTADDGPAKNTFRSEAKYMRGIQAFHMGPSRNWNDIAYNYVIMPSGRVLEGRGFGIVGAHAPGYNTHGIGICLVGNNNDPATVAQVAAYYQLIARLRRKGANITDFKAHGDVFNTSCPGKGIRRQLGL